MGQSAQNNWIVINVVDLHDGGHLICGVEVLEKSHDNFFGRFFDHLRASVRDWHVLKVGNCMDERLADIVSLEDMI